MSLLVIILGRRMRFGEVVGAWLEGCSILASLQVTFYVRDMRSETSMMDLG